MRDKILFNKRFTSEFHSLTNHKYYIKQDLFLTISRDACTSEYVDYININLNIRSRRSKDDNIYDVLLSLQDRIASACERGEYRDYIGLSEEKPRQKILVICGVSGSGKNVLEKKLIKDFPSIFYKLQQFTTRDMRPNEKQGDPYVFTSIDNFKSIEHLLIGIVGNNKQEKNIWKNTRYGSLLELNKDKIATVILSEEGLKDLERLVDNPASIDLNFNISHKDIFVLGLDIDKEYITEEGTRDGRDDDFLEKERKVLEMCNYVYKNDNGKFMSTFEVLDLLYRRKFI